MKPPLFHYLSPGDLDEALDLLSQADADIRPIAGGQSLVPMMSLRLAGPATLLDLGRIKSLRGIRVTEDGELIAGAMTRHSDFEYSELVRTSSPLLHAAMPNIAHMPIRNRGTIGGSLAHADPAGDWPALCVACNAQLVLSKRGAERTVPADEFGCGIFSTVLEADELLTQICFPSWPQNRRWGLQKMTRRRGDFAIAGIVALLDLSPDGLVEWARIVVFGATDMPTVLHKAAAQLVGRSPDSGIIKEAAEAVANGVEVRSDLHASAEYRHQLVRVLTQRALEQALPEVKRYS